MQTAEAGAEIAALEARRQRAGHLPTLDAVATYGQTGQTASSTVHHQRDRCRHHDRDRSGCSSRFRSTRGARSTRASARPRRCPSSPSEDLENARRTAALSTRQNYLARDQRHLARSRRSSRR